MNDSEVVSRRLRNQGLSKIIFKDANDAVEQFGAVQSQDYAGAKWALGQRIKNATDESIEQAFNEGKILRTHIMRPTWHFVAPEDIRWLLKLTAPRIRAASAYMYRTLELDPAIFKKSRPVLEKTLRGGRHLTRAELASALKQAGISGNLLRFTYLVGDAELEGLICSGPRRGKQFTYALLEERVLPGRKLDRDESLAELSRRYFATRGPATLQDFVWWSGLTVADAKRGIEMVKSQLVSEEMGNQAYWFRESKSPQKEKLATAYLLPNYDEYIVGYTDRSLIHDISHNRKLDARGNVLFQNTIVVNGKVAGTWKRTLKAKMVEVQLSPFMAITKSERRAMIDAAERYGRFLNLPVKLAWLAQGKA